MNPKDLQQFNTLTPTTFPESETTPVLGELNQPVVPVVPATLNQVKQETLLTSSTNKKEVLAQASDNKRKKADPEQYTANQQAVLLQQAANHEQTLLDEAGNDLGAYINDPRSNVASPNERARMFRENTKRKLQKEYNERAHTGTDLIKDTGLSVAKGAVNLAAMAPAIGMLASGGKYGLDTYKKLSDVNQFLGNTQSAHLQDEYAEITQAYKTEFINNKAQAIVDGTDDDLTQDITSFFKEAGVAATEAVKNPTALLDIIFEEVPSFVAGGVLGKQAIKQAIKSQVGKKATTEEFNKFIQSEVGKKLATKAGTTAGVTMGGLEEGSSVSMEAANEVMDMSFEDLSRTSPLYNKYLESGLSEEEAKSSTAADVGIQAFVVGTAISAFTSKVSGAGKLEGNILSPANTKGKVVKAGATEGGEEFVQGSATQGAANVIVQEQANTEKDVREGLGLEAGLGTVAGGTIGAGAQTLTNVGAKVDDAQQKATKAKAERAKKKQAKEDAPIVAPKVEKPVKPAEQAKYSVSKVDENIEKVVDKSVEPVERVTALQEAEVHKNKLAKTILANMDLIEKETDDKKKAELVKKVKEDSAVFKALNEQISSVADAAAPTKEETKALTETMRSATASVDDKQTAKNTIILNSRINPESVSEDAIDSVLESDDTSIEEINFLNNVKKTKAAYAKLATPGETGKSTEEVSSDVFAGGESYTGLKQFRADITGAIASGDQTSFNNEMGKLVRFKGLQSSKLAAFNEASEVLKDVNPKAPLSKLPLNDVQKKALKTISSHFATTGKYAGANVNGLNKILDNVRNEVEAIEATEAELLSATKLPQDNIKVKKKAHSGLTRAAAADKAGREFIANIESAETATFIKRNVHNAIKILMKKRDLNSAVTQFVLNNHKKSKNKLADSDLKVVNDYIKAVATSVGEEKPIQLSTAKIDALVKNPKKAQAVEQSLNEIFLNDQNEANDAIDTSVFLPSEASESKEPVVSGDANVEAVSKTTESTKVEEKTEIDEEDLSDISFLDSLQDSPEANAVDTEEDDYFDPSDFLGDTQEVPTAEEVEEVNEVSALNTINTFKDAGKYKELTPVADAVINSIDEDTNIYYVAEDSTHLVEHANGEKALGSYDAKTKTVYISNAVKGKKLEAEVVLHELLHSLLWDSALPKASNSTAQKKFYTESKKLLSQVKTAAKKDGRDKEFEYALNDVQEFIVIGMTNPDFVAYLSEVKVDNERSALAKFATMVAELLGLSKDSVSALEQLISLNSTVLAGAKEPTPEAKPHAEFTNYFSRKNKGDNASIVSKTPELFDGFVNNVRGLIKKRFSSEEVNDLNAVADFVNNFVKNFDERIDLSVYDKRPLLNLPGLLSEDGSAIPRDIVTELAITGYQWMSTEAAGLLDVDDTDIKQFLGMSEHDTLPVEIHELLQQKGLPVSYLASKLGKAAYNKLGISALPTSQHNLDSKMETALGLTILETLQESGVIVSETIDAKQINSLIDETEIEVDHLKGNIATYTADSQTTEQGTVLPSETILSFSKAFNDNRDVLSQLFDPEFDYVVPTFEKPTKKDVPKTMKGTQQRVSPDQQEAILSHSQNEQSLKEDMVSIWSSLDRTQKLALGNYVANEGVDERTERRAGIEGKNEAVKRIVDLADAFITEVRNKEDGLKSPFYFLHTVWKNLRMGLNSKTFNPQQHHIHRHLSGSKRTNETEVGVTGKRRNKLENAFLSGVALAFGEKVEAKGYEDSAQYVVDMLETDDALNSALDTLTLHINGTQGVNLQPALDYSINSGEEPMYVLDALVNLARYREAKEAAKTSGKQTFIADLFYEVDGVTNGPWITKEQLGATEDLEKTQDDLARGGATNKSKYSTYRKNDTAFKDFYEVFAKHTLEGFVIGLQDRIAQAHKYNNPDGIQKAEDQQKAMFFFLGDIAFTDDGELGRAARNFGKTGLIPANYGAGVASLTSAVMRDVKDGVYSKIKEANNLIIKGAETNDRAAIEEGLDLAIFTLGQVQHLDFSNKNSQFNSIVNSLTKVRNTPNLMNRKNPFITNIRSGLLLEMPINLNYEAAVKDKRYPTGLGSLRNKVVAPGIRAGLDNQQGRVTVHRQFINQSISITVAMYNLMYDTSYKLVKAANKKRILAELDYVPSDDAFLPTKAQIKAIEGKLSKFKPVVHNYFSAKNKSLKQATYVGKRKSLGSTAQHNETTIKVVPKSKGDQKTKSTFAEETVLVDSGVAPTIGGVIGIDAAIMTLQIAQADGLNIHDAFGFSMEDVMNGSVDMNMVTHKVLSNYSILASATARMKQVFNGYEKTAKELGLTYDEMWGSIPNDVIANVESIFAAEKVKVKDVELHGAEARKKILLNFNKHMQQKAASNENLRKTKGLGTIKYLEQYSGGFDGYKIPTTAETKSPKTLGSSTDRDSTVEYSKVATIQEGNLYDVFDGIAEGDLTPASPEHQAELKEVLSGVVEGVIKPIDVLVGATHEENHGHVRLDDNEIYVAVQTANNGVTPSGQLANGLRMSSQEVLAHELVHSTTAFGIENNALLAQELAAIYSLVKDQITVEAFMNDPAMAKTDPDYAIEYAAAKVRYDHIFSPKEAKTDTAVNPITGKTYKVLRSNHLHELVALGLTNENLGKALKNMNIDSRTPESGSVFGHIKNWFNGVKDYVFKMLHGFDRNLPMSAHDKLFSLAQSLSEIERRNKRTLVRKYSKLSEQTEDVIHDVSNKIGNIVTKFATEKLEKSNLLPISLFGSVIRVTTENKWGRFISMANDVRHQLSTGKEGIVGNVVTEIIGRTKENSDLLNQFIMGAKEVDKARMSAIEYTTSSIKDKFEDLTKEADIALTKVGIKADLSSLLDFTQMGNQLDMDTQLAYLDKLVRDPAELAKEIASTRKLLAPFTAQEHFYDRMAESLGSVMMSGKPTEDLVILNAYNIARVNYNGAPSNLVPSTVDADRAEKIIDKLATLYALQRAPKKHVNNFVKALDSESGKSVYDNGIMFSLLVHANVKDEAMKRTLKGQRALFIKGYTKEIYNPHIGVVTGTIDDEETLNNLGYTRGAVIPKEDPSVDTNTDQVYLFKNPNGGQAAWMSGLFSTTNNSSKGTNTVAANLQHKVPDPFAAAGVDVNRINGAKASAAIGIFGPRTSAAKAKSGVMAGIYDRFGNVVDYRYLMTEDTKDTLLEKNNKASDVLGAMFGNIEDKITSAKQNKEAVELLHKDYTQNYNKYPERYIEISPDSDDPDMRAAYNMLTEDTLQHMRKVWGTSDKFYVRREDINIVLGYRKASVRDLWDIPEEERKYHHKTIIAMAEGVLGKKAPARLQHAENILLELTKMAKDNIVVKGIAVTAVNYMSNVSTLAISGVSFKDIIVGHKEAFESANLYQKASKELYESELLLNSGAYDPVNKTALENRIAQLKHEIDNNPIKELVDAGMLQTIVEDLGASEDEYSYKQQWLKKLDDKTAKFTKDVPPAVKSATKNFFMAHDTKAYEFANNLVQLSDFSARYILYKHLTTRKHDKLDPKAAFEHVMDIFIVYDLPTNKHLQYLNDVGVLWFTKYLLRNQRAIGLLVTNNTLRTSAHLILENFTGQLSDIMDTLMTPSAIGYRFNGNPFNLLSTVGEQAPLSVTASITN